uniref:Gsp_30 putative toxin n=1 Tax=Gemmula speciosa TaxID=439592 RepID=A0A098LXU4_GEMSP
MRFHVLLTVALILTSFMNVDTAPVDHAERERSTMKKRITCTECNNCLQNPNPCSDGDTLACQYNCWT